MGHAVTVYAAAALLVAASAGPVLASVRDASLLEFEAVDEPRTLNDFPFLKSIEPYLPPIIVDWLIIRPDADLDLPADVHYRVDRDGRVILVWPDGCEETQEEFRDGSRCAPPEPVDCGLEPMHPDCVVDPCPPGTSVEDTECPPLECPPGHVEEDGECVEETPPVPQCPDGHTLTVHEGCIATVTHALTAPIVFEGTTGDSAVVRVELVAHYANLSLEVERSGWPVLPGWRIEVHHEETGETVCWVPRDDPEVPGDCDPASSSGTSGAATSLVDDGHLRPIPPGHLSLAMVYEPSSLSTSPDVQFRLFGRPTDP